MLSDTIGPIQSISLGQMKERKGGHPFAIRPRSHSAIEIISEIHGRKRTRMEL